MTGGLKFRIKVEEGLYYPCSENEGADQLRSYCAADLRLCFRTLHVREHPHMFYTPSFTLLYSRKGEMRGTQNEGLFSGLD